MPTTAACASRSYTEGASDALVRGGRYDEVGAVFGRNRPAVGFSLDVRELVGVVAPRALKAAIRAPWGDAAELRAAIAACVAAAKPWSAYCPATKAKSMNSSATASWCWPPASGSCAPSLSESPES